LQRREFLKSAARTAALAGIAPLVNAAEASVPNRLTIAAVGDCIPSRRISERRDKPFLDLVELLRSADCTWGNCETPFADASQVRPAYKDADPYTLCDPWGADELAWMGIDFMSTANNHIMDWGPEGMYATHENLGKARIAFAGSGSDLARAARPGYFESAAGRIGQVNCASTFEYSAAAGDAHPYVLGRPGLNPLRLDRVIQVEPELYEKMAGLQKDFLKLSGFADFEKLIDEVLAKRPKDTAYFDETLVKSGDHFDVISTPNEEDVKRITQAIGIAKNNARVVMATIHCHECHGALETNDPFLETFAHACIDAGADMFFSSGPHVLRGLEIYKGKPIFYSLANFIMHVPGNTVPAGSYAAWGLPKDTLDESQFEAKIPYNEQPRFWRSVVPKITVDGGTSLTGGPGRVTAIEMHPITLGFKQPIWRHGTPELAEGKEASEILETMATLSKPFGTRLRIQGRVAHVDLT